MNNELTPEQQKGIEQIQKLLNLAAKNPNEHEAAAATAKAQELLVKYNLEAAVIERASGKDGKREETKVDGGFYQFQRDLWKSVAELNFCLYWTQMYRATAWRYVDRHGSKSMQKGEGKTRQNVGVLKYRHALVGRVVNTRSTIVMAQYLQQAIERVTNERLSDDSNRTSSWAMSFRKGCAQGVIEKVEDEREEHLRAERDRRRAAERAGTGASTGSAMVLSTYIDEETDANMDFIHGAGWSAEQARLKAEWAAEAKREREAYTKWAAANPEEARAREEERQKESKRSRWRGGSTPRDNTDYSAYYAGKDASKSISIHKQADSAAGQGRIAR